MEAESAKNGVVAFEEVKVGSSDSANIVSFLAFVEELVIRGILTELNLADES